MHTASDWYGLLVMLYLAFCAACGLWAAHIMERKGRSVGMGLGCGLLLGLTGVLIAALLPDEKRAAAPASN